MAVDGSALGMTKDATNCKKHEEKYFCESVISECISASGFAFEACSTQNHHPFNGFVLNGIVISRQLTFVLTSS